MVNLLIRRPIAVTMTFIAIIVLGVISSTLIPVSLMPDIDIPEITVQIDYKNVSARQLENAVVRQLRFQLMQVSHLKDIKSETKDEKSIISLSFEYNTSMDYAFIEVNEKIDQAMNHFPREVSRPRVIKASATDVPVFYLNLVLAGDEAKRTSVAREEFNSLFPVSKKFVDLSTFTKQVICKRLEQLPEVAMADVTGLASSEFLIAPDFDKLESMQLSLDALEKTIASSNINLGNLLIKDGQYQYNVRFNSVLASRESIENLYLNMNGRLLQVKDIARVIEHPQSRKGLAKFNGKDALVIAIIKQSDARMGDLEAGLDKLIRQFTKDYPDIKFAITRDQTELLDYSISNLNQSLIAGGFLAFIMMFFFLKDVKSPLLIGISMPASLILSLIFFYVLDISINVISLSGLVLGLGMMIDNSIIVIDNIGQHYNRGSTLQEACIYGTNEVFFPMFSSMLTGCAVFIPLIFLNGISGALFHDQAIAVVAGHLASLIVSVTVIPVYYFLVFRNKPLSVATNWLSKINSIDYERVYEQSFRFIIRNQTASWGVVAVFLVLGILVYVRLPKSRLPPVARKDVIVSIGWNERVNLDENDLRVQHLLTAVSSYVAQSTSLIGEQQFLHGQKTAGDASQVNIYIQSHTPENLVLLQDSISAILKEQYPEALLSFKEADNLFNLIFPEEDPPLIVHLRSVQDHGARQNETLKGTLSGIKKEFPEVIVDAVSWQENMVLEVDAIKMLLYDISYESLYQKLKTVFNKREIFIIKENQNFIPVFMGNSVNVTSDTLAQTLVANRNGRFYPVSNLVHEVRDYDLKTIIAGQQGEYVPINFDVIGSETENVISRLRSHMEEQQAYELDFSGSFFSNKALIEDLAFILVISLALLYFILSAQFESLFLPLIVLIEVPIDIAGSFLFLNLFDAGINLMSLIGIVIMCGIIINDSILKIDTINHLVKQGYSPLRSVLIAGQRRLKPILMTSLTTVLAIVPMLFSSGLGNELQKPLGIALGGGMLIGTIVSLYFIPLCYLYMKRYAIKI